MMPGVAGAQVAAGSVTGLVRDVSGAAVPAALVRAVNANTGVERTTHSNAAGIYTLPGLPSGIYRLSAEMSGFRVVVYGAVRIATGEMARLDFDLAPAAVQDAVNVTSETPMLRREGGSRGAIIDRAHVAELPLNGRTFVTLATLAPGVALPPGSLLPRINGGRPRVNEYLFDGISVLQPEPGQVAYFPVIDAIEEFRIETNSPPAEFGRFNGGVVNLTTKSGTNAVHGTLFEFLRHESLNARPVFAPAGAAPPFRRSQFGGVLGGPIRRDRTFFFADYQGQRQSIGRTVISTVPTVLQRAGVFTEPVGGRVPAIYDPATTIETTPGHFTRAAFAGNAIPADRIDPVARALLARYPAPTSAGPSNNFRRTGTETVDQDQFDLRVDHRFASGRNGLFARLSHFHESFEPVAPLPDGSGLMAGTLGPQRTRAWAFASGYQRTLSDRALNELRVGDTRRALSRSAAALDSSDGDPITVPALTAASPFARTLPTFQISGYQQLGSPPNTASRFSTGVVQVADTLTWQVGRHTLKAGLDLRWARLNVFQPPSPAGVFSFSNAFTDLPGVTGTGSPLASFLLGQVQTYSLDIQREEIRNRAHVEEYFVQDAWKVSDRWTVSPGLRYTLNFPSVEAHDQAAVFNLETRRLEYLGRDGNPRAARTLHKLDLGPRLGLAGLLTDRTVLSAGYAVVWIDQSGITTPFTTPAFPFLQTVSQRSLDDITPAFTLADGPTAAPVPLTPEAGLGQGVFAVNRDLGSGYVQQWNVAVRRELTPRTLVEVGYVGSTITRVGIPDSNINQLTVDQLALGPALLERVPNPFYGTIPASSSLGGATIPVAQLLKPYPQYTTVSLYRNNVGTTRYNGITATFERRLEHGLTFLASYTGSRLVDDASSVFDASVLTGPVANFPVADSYDLRLERDRSTGDIPHVFVASGGWQMPFGPGQRWEPSGLAGLVLDGWTVTGIVTLQSGVPVAVTQSTNFNAFAGFGTQRPNLVGDPELPRGERSAGRWFNTDAFAVAPPFTLGTSSRNPVRGPSYRNVDLALIRRGHLAANQTIELRIEAFNLLDTRQLGNPHAVLGAADFGSITTAGDPRVVQLGVKLVF